MKYAADFRAEARDALRGRWPIAILTGFVASLIGASIATGGGGSGSSNSNSNSTRMLIDEFRISAQSVYKIPVISSAVTPNLLELRLERCREYTIGQRHRGSA